MNLFKILENYKMKKDIIMLLEKNLEWQKRFEQTMAYCFLGLFIIVIVLIFSTI